MEDESKHSSSNSARPADRREPTGIQTQVGGNQQHSDSGTGLDADGAKLVPSDSGVESRELRAAAFQQQVESHYSGPLPPPELLAQYGQVMHDAPERILRMAEQNGQALYETSKRESQAIKFSAIVGALVPFGLMVLTGLLAFLGQEVATIIAGAASCLSASASIIQAIKGSKSEGKNTEEK